MADGVPRRTSTRLNLALLLGVLVLWVAAGCGAEPGPAAGLDANDSVDVLVNSTDEVADSSVSLGPMDEPTCLQHTTPCKTAQWHPDWSCDVKINAGAACSSHNGPCGGVCSANAECVLPGPEVDCGTKVKACMACDGKGGCKAKSGATTCKAAAVPACHKPTGTCAQDTSCVHDIDVGAPCKTASPLVQDGFCSDKGVCLPGVLGGPCVPKIPSACLASEGTVTAAGDCHVEPMKTGTPCPIASSGECVESAGLCDKGGACSPVPKAKGVPCKVSSSGPCSMACDGTGQCVFVPGIDCNLTSGPCAGKPGVCTAYGYCSPSPPCSQKSDLLPCGEFAIGQACAKKYTTAQSPGDCKVLSPYPTANSNSCGDAGDPCQPKMCSLDLNSSPTCTAGQMPDGAPCPGVAANPCSAATCLSGKCQKAFKPAGTPCTPLAPKQCGAHECNAAGECAAVVPAVPLAGSCTLSDGDTDCWAKSCDSAGNCQKVPRPAGEHCGVVPDDACTTHTCNGKGACVPELKSETALCAHDDCLLPTAKPMSPCPVDPCVYSVCMKLGLCKTTYRPTGASCEIKGMAGTCSESHQCVLVGKGIDVVAGNLCIGHFPCMKEDVAIGEDGVCHGTFATGGTCGTPCKPGICGADGTCQTGLAPKGTACSTTALCGNFECDGKGECAMPEAAVGKSCGASYLTKLPECQHYACYTNGFCGPAATVGKPCASTDPCMVGTCGPSGTCEFAPISGPVCDLAKPDSCNSGVCKLGKCEPVPKPGGACGKETACMAYQCDATGQCAGVPKPGASCESTGTCTKGVCDLAGQCTQVLDPGAKCMGKEQCLEGVCSPSGACLLGPKPAGSLCTAAAPGTNWDCYTGVCDGKGGCALKVNTGAKCKEGDGACTTGVCQSDASCKAMPANLGKACSNGCMVDPVCTATGECKGTPTPGKTCYDQCLSDATCTAQGECVGTAKTGKACGNNYGAPACQSYACSGAGKCVKKSSPAGSECVVGAVFPSEIPAYPCGSPKGTCNDGGACVPAFTDPDGTPCGADDGCANAHVCKDGSCVPVEPKANGTPCKFGCATGSCGAGACMAKVILAFFPTVPSGPCEDGSECTLDFCIGSPLPGMSISATTSFSPEFSVANAGKCYHELSTSACPNGKPPDLTSCIYAGCPKNKCGTTMICKLQIAGGGCVTPVGPPGWDAPACKQGNPCATASCWNDECYYSPEPNSKSCGAFKHCMDGKCVAID